MGDHELYMETWGGLHPLEGYKSGACVGSGVSFKPGGKMLELLVNIHVFIL